MPTNAVSSDLGTIYINGYAVRASQWCQKEHALKTVGGCAGCHFYFINSGGNPLGGAPGDIESFLGDVAVSSVRATLRSAVTVCVFLITNR